MVPPGPEAWKWLRAPRTYICNIDLILVLFLLLRSLLTNIVYVVVKQLLGHLIIVLQRHVVHEFGEITKNKGHYAVQSHSIFNITDFGTSQKLIYNFLLVIPPILHDLRDIAFDKSRPGYRWLLWPPCVADADIIFLPCGFLFFSSPNLSHRRLDVYHTPTHGVALVRI